MILMSARSKTQPPTSGLAQGEVCARRKFVGFSNVRARANICETPPERQAPNR